MYAIIQTGGKQYKVSPGDVIFIEKLSATEGDEVSFDVLMVSKDDEVLFGTPVVEGVQAQGKVLSHGRGKKIIVYKFKAKKNYRRKQGHRQPFTKVEITAIAGA
jgi:large subunit ribosomal protein L21